MKTIKSSEYHKIIPFDVKYKNAYEGICKSPKCFRYYYKLTKNTSFSISEVFKYIDKFYARKKPNKNMSCDDESKALLYLLNRYDYLNYKTRISFSIISSVAISIIITLIFSLLQLSDKDGLSYFLIIQNISEFDKTFQIDNPLAALFVLLLQFIALAICFSILVVVAWYVIVLIRYIYLLNTQIRLVVVPYERETIAKTIKTYNLKLRDVFDNQ